MLIMADEQNTDEGELYMKTIINQENNFIDKKMVCSVLEHTT